MTIKRMLEPGVSGAEFKASSIDETNRTVSLIWTTGSKGLRSSWGERFYEELSLDPKHVDMTRLKDGAPVLAAHDDSSLDSVIGVVESATVDGKVGTAVVRFAKDDYSERIFQKVKDRILRNVSVGYSVAEYTDVSEPGDEIPTYRATRWQPAELSIVPIGFDAGAKTRNQSVNTLNEVEIITTKESEPMDKKAILAEERKRVSEIKKLTREAGLEDSFADELCEKEDMTAEKASSEILRRVLYNQKVAESTTTGVDPHSQSRATAISVGSTPQQRMKGAVIDSLAARIDRTYKPKTDTREFDGRSLISVAEKYVGRNLMESDVAFAQRAMATTDLPNILSDSAEKAMQNRYVLTPRSFEPWVKKDTLNNYKQASRLRVGDFASLVERAENADFTEASPFGEEKELVTLKDYGIMYSFSSKMVVNDDLRVLQQIATEGASSAARKENALVYSALVTNKTMGDSVALYHASHGNLGTAGAISETTVAEAVKLMRKQTTADGLDTLNASPRFLICGPDQEHDAKKFLALINPVQTSNVNPYAGSMQLIVDASITGNQYYFAADPNLIPSVVLYHLAGQEAPQIDSRIKWENNSLQMKVAHAIAAEPLDWRGLVKNAGQ